MDKHMAFIKGYSGHKRGISYKRNPFTDPILKKWWLLGYNFHIKTQD